MAIINVKNPDLYRAWLRYYERTASTMTGPQMRTSAFFNSQAGHAPPNTI